MSRKLLIALASGGSVALLLGALAFQYIGGLAPCHLCILQRWPHGAAILAGGLALVTGWRIWPWIGAAAAAATAAIGLFHTGVEQKWWQGPASCTGSGGSVADLSGADLLSPSGPTGMVLCDRIAWEMAGISMAGWNAILSAILVLLWLAAALRRD